MLLLDLDGFKAVNDSLGHAAGDRYLSAVAYRLARAVPAGGCLVRQGGDEFTIVVPGTDAEGLATAIGAGSGSPRVISNSAVGADSASAGGTVTTTRALANALPLTAVTCASTSAGWGGSPG